MRDDRPRCPACHALVADWWDHTECLDEQAKTRHDETHHDDYPEPPERH